MLGEILSIEKIFILEEKTLQEALNLMKEKTPVFEKKEDLFREFQNPIHSPFNSISKTILVPHIRIPKLKSVQAILGVFPKGIMVGDSKIHILLLLATPKERPSVHLQILQGLSSLLPSIEKDLLLCKSTKEVFEKFQSG